MNREIKFRAWDNNLKEWFWYAEELWSLRPEVTEVLNGDRKREDIILTQFTGLLDKNGREIYEGDVIRIEFDDELREVVFWEGCFCNKWDDKRGHIFNPKKSQVIGNVYENPDLLDLLASLSPNPKT